MYAANLAQTPGHISGVSLQHFPVSSMMTPHNELQQTLKNKCQRCFLVPRLFCASTPCCNLNMCTKCFFHDDHPCGPGTKSVPVRRCLDRCHQRLDNGWGDRCWMACKRAFDHQGFCDCLGDHTGWAGPCRVPQCPIFTNVLKPVPKSSCVRRPNTCTCNVDPPLCLIHSAYQADSASHIGSATTASSSSHIATERITYP